RQLMSVRVAEDILARVRAIPGVKSAAFASVVPVYGGRTTTDNVTVRDGQSNGDKRSYFAAVTPDFFSTMGISLLSGHDIARPTSGASRSETRDVVVNEKFAKKFFAGREPLGQLFYDNDEGDTVATPNRVVGVVGNAKYAGVRD